MSERRRPARPHPYLRYPPGFTTDGQCRDCVLHARQLAYWRPYVAYCGVTTGDADHHAWWWPAHKDLPPPFTTAPPLEQWFFAYLRRLREQAR